MKAFRELNKNARTAIISEPFNTVPYNLYKPYFSRFMLSVGLSKAQIGLFGAINMVMHLLAALLSTVLVDRFGRKRTMLVVDLLGWVLPCAVWAVGRTFGWFVLGATLGALWRISNSAWHCLIVEDTPAEDLLPVYARLNTVQQAAAFVTPLAGVVVGLLGLQVGMVILLWFSAAMMLLRVAMLFVGTHETQTGQDRRQAVRSGTLAQQIAASLASLRTIFHTAGIRASVFFLFLIYVNKLLYDTYFPLLLTENIALPDATIAFFTVARSAAALLCGALLSRRIRFSTARRALLWGMAVGIGCFVAMPLLPRGSYIGVALAFASQGLLLALVEPVINSMLAIYLPDAQRASITGLAWMCVHAVCIPVSLALGSLAQIDMRLPFAFVALLFLPGVWVAVRAGKRLAIDAERRGI